jgi:hypothetical protein
MTRASRRDDSENPTPSPSPSAGPESDTPSSTGASPSPDVSSGSSDSNGSAGSGASPTPEPVPGLGSTNEPNGAYQPPTQSSPDSEPTGPAPNPETTAAVQTALGAEYAAIWTYTLITAFLDADLQTLAQQDVDAHRARRDATIRLLTDYRVPPAPAEPAYWTPAPVTDSSSAVRLAVSAESDASAAWCSVLERCDDQGLRHIALDGLTDSAVRGAHWSAGLGSSPVVPAFPGRSPTP